MYITAGYTHQCELRVAAKTAYSAARFPFFIGLLVGTSFKNALVCVLGFLMISAGAPVATISPPPEKWSSGRTCRPDCRRHFLQIAVFRIRDGPSQVRPIGG